MGMVGALCYEIVMEISNGVRGIKGLLFWGLRLRKPERVVTDYNKPSIGESNPSLLRVIAMHL